MLSLHSRRPYTWRWRCTAQGALRMYTAGGRGHARKRQKARAGGRVARHDGCLVPGHQKGEHACLAWEVIASPPTTLLLVGCPSASGRLPSACVSVCSLARFYWNWTNQSWQRSWRPDHARKAKAYLAVLTYLRVAALNPNPPARR